MVCVGERLYRTPTGGLDRIGDKYMNDFLNNEINVGDIILYNEKSSRGYCTSFSEGIVVMVKRDVVLLDIDKKHRYQEVLDHYAKYNRLPYYVNRKHAFNTINLTALGARERVELK